ncbi:MAG: hypothetical protein J6S10_00825 [Clostridia bacterium]|nr:hypothetical protein [Clostridia bacterium]
MFKKILAIALCALMLFVVIACDQTPTPDNSGDATTTTTTTTGNTAKTAAELTAYLSTVTYNRFELTNPDEPYFVGRWFDKDVNGEAHKVTLTDGSLFYFLVEGAASFDVNFTEMAGMTPTPYFAYSIDGATPVRQLVTNPTVTLPDTNPHTVRIIADGMTASRDAKWVNEQGIALKNVTAPAGGAIWGIKPTEKVIYYFGDSITEGIMALATTPSASANSDTNSATGSYAWYCSEALGAVHYSIGYSGSGILDPGSFAVFTDAIDHYSENRLIENESVKPDVIIINHGCNDIPMHTDAGVFIDTVKAGIATLQELYPDAPIYYVVPFDQKWSIQLSGALKNTAGVTVIKTNGWTEGVTFADDNLHPTAAGGQVLGAKLAAALKEALGEDFFN